MFYWCSFEILHARWAMLAALGALVPELLDLLGAFHFTEPVWWLVGYSKLKVSNFGFSKISNDPCIFGLWICLICHFSTLLKFCAGSL